MSFCGELRQQLFAQKARESSRRRNARTPRAQGALPGRVMQAPSKPGSLSRAWCSGSARGAEPGRVMPAGARKRIAKKMLGTAPPGRLASEEAPGARVPTPCRRDAGPGRNTRREGVSSSQPGRFARKESAVLEGGPERRLAGQAPSQAPSEPASNQRLDARAAPARRGALPA